MATIQTNVKVNIGLSEKNREAVAKELTKLLADEHVLYNKTRSYHWNVESSNFMELHKLFEEQYTQIAENIDQIAERIRALGFYAEGRLGELLKLAELQEPEIPSEAADQIANLLLDHETLVRNLREYIKVFADKYEDDGSSDFVTGLLREHEKTAWMLRSYLK